MNRMPHNVLLVLLFLIVMKSVAAHHNTGALFDLTQEVTLEGTISKYEWKNPHLYFFVETADDKGGVAVWRVEAGPLALMRRLGWSRDSLNVGDSVSVTGSPSRKDGKNSAFLRAISVADRELPAFASPEGFKSLQSGTSLSPEITDGITGTWATLLDIEVTGPIDEPSKLDLTPAGTASIDEFDENTMHPGLECIPFTAPAVMLTPDFKSIEIDGDVVIIRGEFDNTRREIHLNSTAKAYDAPALQGHSTGRWNEGVLMIETTNFAEHRSGIGFGLASSSQKFLKEEFELAEDGKSLIYRFDLRDPVYLEAPFAGEIRWAYQPDVTYSPQRCDLENSRLFLDE